jgi:RNA polymerase sigma-70 factor, ECF subfamily
MRTALAGDSIAYETLLAKLASALRMTVRAALSRLRHGNAEVEDIIQETLLAVHLKRNSWNPALPLAPWVSAIARYKIVDSLRRQGHQFRASLEDLTDAIPAQADTSADHSDVERLVRRLGDRDQRIVRAASIEGRPAAEIAVTLGMTEGAVRVALHRALKELARLYRS